MTRSRELTANLALCLLSALLVLGVVEAGMRILGYQQPRRSGYPRVRGNRAHEPKNRLEFRDVDHPLAKPCGERRILVLGDSFAAGFGVEFDDAFPVRLGRGLSRRRHETWTLINLARPGMGTVEEAGELFRSGFQFAPDVVLLAYVLNDAETDQAAWRRRSEAWLSMLEERERLRIDGGLLGWSALYRVLRERVENTRLDAERVRYHRSLYRDSNPGWGEARRSLQAIARECRSRGIPFVVAVFPLFGNRLDEAYPFADIHDTVSHAARSAGATVLDLLPVYRGLDWRLLVEDAEQDEHPNEIGHRIAADAILGGLDGLEPPPPQCADAADARRDPPFR